MDFATFLRILGQQKIGAPNPQISGKIQRKTMDFTTFLSD